MADEVSPAVDASTVAAPTERGWGKFLLAVIAFIVLPGLPQFQAILPLDQTLLLFVPAVAACALVGWWAGGRPFLAIAWVVLAALVILDTRSAGQFSNLTRGWSLLLAGSFGLICLFGDHRPLFVRSLAALGMTLALATIMMLIGPVTSSRAQQIVTDELSRRDSLVVTGMEAVVRQNPKEWKQLTDAIPMVSTVIPQIQTQLSGLSNVGRVVFPALLALESLAALGLAWATYHRLGRTRLGAPLRPLKEFRFNDQLVWGLIAGLAIVLLPTLSGVSDLGKNLLVFFGALYALRGFGVLSWFTAPGRLGSLLAIGFVMLWAPVLNAIAGTGFIMLGITSLALGLGDTWADWRRRASPAS